MHFLVLDRSLISAPPLRGQLPKSRAALGDFNFFYYYFFSSASIVGLFFTSKPAAKSSSRGSQIRARVDQCSQPPEPSSSCSRQNSSSSAG